MMHTNNKRDDKPERIHWRMLLEGQRENYFTVRLGRLLNDFDILCLSEVHDRNVLWLFVENHLR